MMMTLFDEEQVMRAYVESEKMEVAKKAIGRMLQKGKLTVNEIADYFPDLSIQEIREIEKELFQTTT